MNEDQRQHWNSQDSAHWVTSHERFDRQLQPFADALFVAADIKPGELVLDIGCGCGNTTMRAAALGAQALGVDLSGPMLTHARKLAAAAGIANVEFREGDAQTDSLGPDDFDVAISRFGVMFFEDPSAAFANIASALKPGGRLAFVSWQDLGANEWLLRPGLAAAAHLPMPESANSDGPGMFGLSKADRVKSLLEGAGFSDVDLVPFETPMLLAGGGPVEDAVEFLLSTGVGRAMFEGAEPAARAAAIEAVTAVMADGHDGEGVRLGAATWVVTARRD